LKSNSQSRLPLADDNKTRMQDYKTEDNPFAKDEKAKIQQKREELKNISDYLRNKIESKPHNRKKLDLNESPSKTKQGLDIGSDGLEALKRLAMEAEAK